MAFPLRNPSPSFEAFREALVGEEKPDKVHFAELFIDFEVMNFISKRLMKEEIPSISHVSEKKEKRFIEGKDVLQLTEEEKSYHKGIINFYYRMGYDYVPVWSPRAPIPAKRRVTDDTAILSRGKREWVEETEGIITSWQDFEAFPWERVKFFMESSESTKDLFNFLGENLPEGMKISVNGPDLFEAVGEVFLGWVGMFRMMYMEPDLVKAVFDRYGEIIYNQYRNTVSLDCVGIVFHNDDLGYKKGTMIKPCHLREFVLPWMKKYAAITHERGKMFWYHSCGNMSQVMGDLIEDVKIDAFHAFQDVIMPVWDFKKKYGDRISALGGVDVDKLTRFDKEALRRYVKKILRACMPGGRYALGSGNSVTNYIPPDNYLVMLEEGLKWKPRTQIA